MMPPVPAGAAADGPLTAAARLFAVGQAYGHIGATYGFDTMLSYHPALDVTIAIGTNMENDDQTHPSDTLCVLFAAVKNVLTGSADTCAYTDRGYYGGECKCT
jgi:hypothetical protein